MTNKIALLLCSAIFTLCFAEGVATTKEFEVRRRVAYYITFFGNHFRRLKIDNFETEYYLVPNSYEKANSGQMITTYFEGILHQNFRVKNLREFDKAIVANANSAVGFVVYRLVDQVWVVPLGIEYDTFGFHYYIYESKLKWLERWDFRQYQIFDEKLFFHFRSWQTLPQPYGILVKDIIVASESPPVESARNLIWENPINAYPKISFEIWKKGNNLLFLKKREKDTLYQLSFDRLSRSCQIINAQGDRLFAAAEIALLSQLHHDLDVIQSLSWHDAFASESLQEKIKDLERQKKQARPLCTPETDVQIKLKGECRL